MGPHVCVCCASVCEYVHTCEPLSNRATENPLNKNILQ